MQYVLVGFFRCDCGKVHCYGGTTSTSVCSCGLKLWDQLWRKSTR